MKTFIIVLLIISLISFLIGYIVNRRKKKKEALEEYYKIDQLPEDTYKHTYNIDEAKRRMEKDYTMETSCPPSPSYIVGIDPYRKDSYDYSKKLKDKENKIANIVQSVKEHKENKTSPKNLAKIISKANKDPLIIDTDLWIWIEQEIAKMTDKEREELQQFINSKKKQ